MHTEKISIPAEIMGYIAGLFISMMLFVNLLIHLEMLVLVFYLKKKLNNIFLRTTSKAIIISYVIYFVFIYIMFSFLIYGKFIL